MTIYIVQGTTGEYSNRNDWLVCAYRTQEQADEHASKATHRAKEIQEQVHKDGCRYTDREREIWRTNEYDPDMQMDYTGTLYIVMETELREDAQ